MEVDWFKTTSKGVDTLVAVTSMDSYPTEVMINTVGRLFTLILKLPVASVSVPCWLPLTVTEAAGIPSWVSALRTVPVSVMDWDHTCKESKKDASNKTEKRELFLIN
jgi:hypothetical protein